MTCAIKFILVHKKISQVKEALEMHCFALSFKASATTSKFVLLSHILSWKTLALYFEVIHALFYINLLIEGNSNGVCLKISELGLPTVSLDRRVALILTTTLTIDLPMDMNTFHVLSHITMLKFFLYLPFQQRPNKVSNAFPQLSITSYRTSDCF